MNAKDYIAIFIITFLSVVIVGCVFMFPPKKKILQNDGHAPPEKGQ